MRNIDEQREQFRAYIQRIVTETGMTPSAIAKAAGVAASTVNRPYSGDETAGAPTLKTIAKIAAATGVPFEGSALTVSAPSVPQPNVRPAPDVALPDFAGMPRDIPIRGIAACSSGDGAFQIEATNVVDWARRPPALAGVRDAYGLYLSGDSMEPRWSHGDMILVHPGRPARPGDHVVLILRDGPHETPYAYCKRLVRRHGGMVTVEQYNPPSQRDFPEERVEAVHRILEMRDLF